MKTEEIRSKIDESISKIYDQTAMLDMLKDYVDLCVCRDDAVANGGAIVMSLNTISSTLAELAGELDSLSMGIHKEERNDEIGFKAS